MGRTEGGLVITYREGIYLQKCILIQIHIVIHV